MAKVFKNNQHLDVEELVVYLHSRIGVREIEIGCFLNNFADGEKCQKDMCRNMWMCAQLKRELDRLDNASTATEIQDLLKPVLLYREEQKREAKSKQWEQGQYKLGSGAKELLCRKNLTPDEMVGYRINIEYDDGQTDWMIFNEAEIQVEFRLRAMRVDAAQKEEKRLEMLKEIYDYDEGAMTFWKKLME